MSKLSNKSNTRLSLASFKAAAGTASTVAQVEMITGGALAGCHVSSAKLA